MRVRFLGSGDTFGSGGRLQTCIEVEAGSARCLVDCGATALVGMRRFGVDPNAIDLILLSHLHGDHFGGVPFFLLDAQFISRRSRPLVVAGPPGTRERIPAAMEALFPGSTRVERRHALEIHELQPASGAVFGGVAVTPYVVEHPSGAPPFALRVEAAGKVLAYSGDTEWTENLVAAARGADLFIAEAYFYEKRVRYHLDLATLLANLDRIGAKRLIVTHMSQDMLARLDGLPCEFAEDGKVVNV